MNGWSTDAMPDQRGRVAIVTGAGSGIGREAAAALARAGARVVLAVRDTAKGDAAAATMRGAVEVRALDLASLDSVRGFVAGWSGEVHLLLNNAGVMAPPEARTADGFELQLGTNHLGHFALTNLLLERVTGRVVTVSSNAHRMGGLDLEDLNWERRSYERWRAYGQSKLANLLFTAELQRRLAAAGSDVLATAAHPGYANTGLFGSGRQGGVTGRVAGVLGRALGQSAAAGALPTLFAATAPDLPPAAYAGPGGRGEARGAPVLVGRSGAAADPELARALWERSEQLTGIGFGLPGAQPAS